MTTASNDRILGLNEFFAASEARVDRWRTLNRVAKALAATGRRPAGGPRHGPEGAAGRARSRWRSSAATRAPV